jgi:hypothetical protein
MCLSHSKLYYTTTFHGHLHVPLHIGAIIAFLQLNLREYCYDVGFTKFWFHSTAAGFANHQVNLHTHFLSEIVSISTLESLCQLLERYGIKYVVLYRFWPDICTEFMPVPFIKPPSFDVCLKDY